MNHVSEFNHDDNLTRLDVFILVGSLPKNIGTFISYDVYKSEFKKK